MHGHTAARRAGLGLLALALASCTLTGLGGADAPQCSPDSCGLNHAHFFGPIDQPASELLHAKIEFCAGDDCQSEEVTVKPFTRVTGAGPVQVDGTCKDGHVAFDPSTECSHDSSFWVSARYSLPVADAGPLPERFRLTITNLDSGERVFDRVFEPKYKLTRPAHCDQDPKSKIMCTGFDQRF